MKKVLISAIAALGFGIMAVPAQAALVVGSISISPLIVTVASGSNDVSGVTGFNLSTNLTGTTSGDLSIFPAGTVVTIINPYTLDSSTDVPGFLSFSYDPDGPGGVDPYVATFDLTDSGVTGRTPTASGGTVNVFALGILHLTGFDDSPASLNFSATQSGGVWSASFTLTAPPGCDPRTTVCTPVPEPLSIALFGVGLAGVAIVSRRRRWMVA